MTEVRSVRPDRGIHRPTSLGGVTALVMAAGTGLISEFYEGHERLTMIARQGMPIELGGVIFLFIGEVLASEG